MKNQLKIILFILGQKGYTVLNSIHQQFSSPIFELVVFAKDTHIKNDYSNEIINFCKKNNIKCVERNSEFQISEGVYLFAIGWKWLLKNNKNLIVLHDSMLPKYRGFAPLVNSLINGENFIGVTALFAHEEYDKGPIICQKKIKILYPIKIQNAIDKISVLYSECILEVLNLISNDRLISIQQNEAQASYSLWRDESDYLINWEQSSEEIKRFIDAVGPPYDGAKTIVSNKLVTILDAQLYPDVQIENRKNNIGKVIFCYNGYPVIVCASGLLMITNLHDIEGNSLLPLKSFRTRFSLPLIKS